MRTTSSAAAVALLTLAGAAGSADRAALADEDATAVNPISVGVRETVTEMGGCVRVRALVASWRDSSNPEGGGVFCAHRVYARHPGGGWQVLGPADDDSLTRFQRVRRGGADVAALLGGYPSRREEIRVDRPVGPYLRTEILRDLQYMGSRGEFHRTWWDVRTGDSTGMERILGAEALVDVAQLAWEEVLDCRGVPDGRDGWIGWRGQYLHFDHAALVVRDQRVVLTLFPEANPIAGYWPEGQVEVPLPERLASELPQAVCPGAFSPTVVLRSGAFDADKAAAEDVAEGDAALAIGDRARALRWWREALAFWAGETDPSAALSQIGAPKPAAALARRMLGTDTN